jgi:hypothetical protein
MVLPLHRVATNQSTICSSNRWRYFYYSTSTCSPITVTTWPDLTLFQQLQSEENWGDYNDNNMILVAMLCK